MTREFNTFGPVNPTHHYHVNRATVKAALRAKIEKGHYFTLNAARQTGKTTLLREVIATMDDDETTLGIILNVENLGGYPPPRMYERLGQQLNEVLSRQLEEQQPAWGEVVDTFIKTAPMRDQGDFSDYLRAITRLSGCRLVLALDEFGAMPVEQLRLLLHEFRYHYLRRWDAGTFSPHSVILVGVMNIPALMAGTQSPFNIADHFDLPYFTATEVAALLAQHTAETGQHFTPSLIEAINRETEGQPFLVNRLGQLLTQEVVPDRDQSVTVAHFNYALARLVNENNTHFASITAKAIPHRRILLPILFYDETRANFREAVTAELLMYGILRVVTDEYGGQLARLANPIYRKVLLLTFTPTLEPLPENGLIRSRYVVNGTLDFDGLLDSFKAFMEAHGVRLLRSEASKRPLEISGQYLLLSYLNAALNSITGYVTIESLSSAGEMDILVFYRGQQFIVETKIWYGQVAFEEAQIQLTNYLQAANLARGYLVIFDEKPDRNPLLVKSGDVFETTIRDKRLRVYLIGVT